MSQKALLRRRLLDQQLVHPLYDRPEDVVVWMGAMQAQDYGWVRWALGHQEPAASFLRRLLPGGGQGCRSHGEVRSLRLKQAKAACPVQLMVLRICHCLCSWCG